MRIAETYRSLQGEGLLTGTESLFVRVSGCNLRCWFCDTPYTSWEPEGDDLSVDELLSWVDREPCSHVVITGGEPMLFAELLPFTAGLRERGRHITIETAGTLYLPVVCDLMSISPKLANSTPAAELAGAWRERHERTRHAPDILRRLLTEYTYQLKFVIDQPDDCEEVEQYLRQFPTIDRSRVLFMPQGTDPKTLAEKSAWLQEVCDQRGYQYCPRRHIEWYGFQRGT